MSIMLLSTYKMSQQTVIEDDCMALLVICFLALAAIADWPVSIQVKGVNSSGIGGSYAGLALKQKP